MASQLPNSTACPHCEQLQHQIHLLQVQIAELQEELAKARKHSGNSSKPSSTDIVNPPRPRQRGRPKKRKRGGQEGHRRHERLAFEAEEIDQAYLYRYEACPCCGGSLQDRDLPPKVQQQVEIVEQPVRIEEHQRMAQWCSRCRKIHYAPFPEELVKAGLIGPRLTALVGWFKGVCHMSFSAIRKFFRDVLGVQVSRGQLAKLVQKVSQSVQDPYEELLNLLTEQDALNVDETGHKDSGKRLWTWCFRAYLFTVFKVSPSRGSGVLIEVLGKEFQGVLGCDYFSAYRKYMRLNDNVLLQFCLAHLIREYKFLAEHPDPRNRQYGQRMLKLFGQLFGIIHCRAEYASPEAFQQALEEVRNQLIYDGTFKSPHTPLAVNLEERFYLHTEEYFRFITTPGIEPTNNLAEQAIRFIAIHRKMTQGTRGEPGQRWVERIATVIMTCAQQGRSAFEFLHDAVDAYLSNQPAPSLAPNTS